MTLMTNPPPYDDQFEDGDAISGGGGGAVTVLKQTARVYMVET